MYTYRFKDATEARKLAVWKKGRTIDGYKPEIWRRDICGRAMKYSDHGKEEKYGWEIDHIMPTSKGGPDHIDNLQPLFWENNRRKGDAHPWCCENAV